MKYASLVIAWSTASLVACDKPEDAPKAHAAPAAVLTAEFPPAPAAATLASAPGTATAPPGIAHGQQVYRQNCAFCHDRGVTGAPKIGDSGDWNPRLAQGMDTLYASALRGKYAMPARGGNPALADADVRAAVDYLAAQVR
ncbi:MAG: c-type cytochrome [Hyphomicrobiaceae bacterium]